MKESETNMNYQSLLILGASILSLLSAAPPAGTVKQEPMRVVVECKLTASLDEAQCGSFQVPEGQRFTAQRFSMRLAKPSNSANRYAAEFTEGARVWRVETPLAGSNARSRDYNLPRPVEVQSKETITVKLNRTTLMTASPTAERVWLQFDGYSTQP
ncbi:MAG: hypothetical protein K2Q23_00345 [Bryobacteraceae bacterium]|nr:hypothetical protein [Bryobacteraceae bacterium]